MAAVANLAGVRLSNLPALHSYSPKLQTESEVLQGGKENVLKQRKLVPAVTDLGCCVQFMQLQLEVVIRAVK